jgi:hypothetical protein
MKTCLACGLVVAPARRDAQYCSNRCRQKSYRRRKAGLGGPQLAAGGLLQRPGWEAPQGLMPVLGPPGARALRSESAYWLRRRG